jgi:hypothetical protein
MAMAREPLARPYKVIAQFADPHELRTALGEIGVRLGGHHVTVDPGVCSIEVEVAEPGVAEAVVEVLWGHSCKMQVLDYESHVIA